MLRCDDISNCARLPTPCVSNLTHARRQARACNNITKSTPYVTYIYIYIYLFISSLYVYGFSNMHVFTLFRLFCHKFRTVHTFPLN